ncbi:MAG: hypothetical protein ACJ71S_15850, partial [Acidobacteriaceae bacterium]
MRARTILATVFATLLVAFSTGAVAQAAAPSAPSITSTAALSHAVIVSISGGTLGATIHYTIDG